MVWNRGDSPLEITKVRACCGAEAAMDSMQIAPGSNSVCRAVFILKNRTGEQNKVIYLASNDRNQPYTSLKITGECQRIPGDGPTWSAAASGRSGSGARRSAIKVVPERITILAGSEKPVERLVVLSSSDKQAVEVVSAELIYSEGTVGLKQLRSDRWQCTLSILPASIQPGAGLRIRTICEAPSEIIISIEIVN